MDTKKLVVGQDVYVVMGGVPDYREGRVVAITPEGVDVETGTDRMHFDQNGVQTDYQPGPEPYAELDDMPYAERKVYLENSTWKYLQWKAKQAKQ